MKGSKRRTVPRDTESLDRHMDSGIGTIIYSSPSFLVLGVGAPPPSVGLRQSLEMRQLHYRRCGGMRTSYKDKKRLTSTQPQDSLPATHHSCSAWASGPNAALVRLYPACNPWRWLWWTPHFTGRNLASGGLKPQHPIMLCSFQPFRCKSRDSVHTTDSTLRFVVQSTNAPYRQYAPEVARVCVC